MTRTTSVGIAGFTFLAHIAATILEHAAAMRVVILLALAQANTQADAESHEC